MGNIRLYGSTSGYTELAPPAVAPDGVLSLPSGTGTIAKTTDSGLQIVSPTSIANSGGSASASGGAVSFTSVSSVSLNGVFTSAYENYRIVMSILGSTASGAFARLRASGTDNTTSNYSYQFISGSTTTVSGAGATGVDYLEMASAITQNGIHVFDFFAPQLATATQIIGAWQNFTSSAPFVRQVAASHNVASAFDGLTVYPQSGTMTGTLRIYGYRNS
jgi:hypothetical protein